MESYNIKENHISPAVGEILWYKQTEILLLLYKDILILNFFIFSAWRYTNLSEF